MVNAAVAIEPDLPDKIEVERPDNKSICINKDCKHAFGFHFLTFNGAVFGCAVTIESRSQKGNYRCPCPAFGIVLKWESKKPVTEDPTVKPNAELPHGERVLSPMPSGLTGGR